MLWWTLRQLRSKDAQTRVKAARKLGELQDGRAVEPLILALKDAGYSMEQAVEEALARIDPNWARSQAAKRAVATLLAAFQDKNSAVRQNVAVVLGKIADGRAVEPLVAALKDEEPYVREAAAGALGGIRDARAVAPLVRALKDDDIRVRAKAAEALGEIGDEEAIEPLVAALANKNCCVREVEKALDRIDPHWRQSEAAKRVLPTLLAKLQDGPGLTAVKALGAIGDEQAIEPLMAALKEEKWAVRAEAVEALGKVGKARPLENLVTALADRMISVRLDARQALEQIDPNWAKSEGARRAVPALVAALKDPHKEVQIGAAVALGEIGDDRAIEPLVVALVNFAVREEVVRALAKIDPDWKKSEGTQRALPTIISVLKDEQDAWVARNAAGVLGIIGGANAGAPLVAALEDERCSVRTGAAEALGQLRDARTVAPLVKRLKDDDPLVRWVAAEALGKIGDPRAVEPLTALLRDPNADVRQAAAEALSRIEKKAA